LLENEKIIETNEHKATIHILSIPLLLVLLPKGSKLATLLKLNMK